MAQLLKGICVLLLAQIFVVHGGAVGADSASSKSSKLEKALKKNEIVPQILPKAPKYTLSVEYPSGVKADLGNELTPTDTKCIPTVEWETEDDALYTVMMFDPDVPSREDQSRGPWIQWLVVNVAGTDVTKGETLDEHISPSPPDDGLRRYVLAAYKQPSKLDFSKETKLTNTSTKGRKQFDISAFAKKYKLELAAVNFFLAKYDSYVPHMLKQVEGKEKPDPCSVSSSSSSNGSCQ